MIIAICALKEDSKTPADNTHGVIVEPPDSSLAMPLEDFVKTYVEPAMEYFLAKERELQGL